MYWIKRHRHRNSIRGFQEQREKAENIRRSLREILRFTNRIPPLNTSTIFQFFVLDSKLDP